MKPPILLLLLLLSSPLLAQETNYVATAPLSSTPAIYNTLVGPNAGNSTLTGIYNVFLGAFAGSRNTTGSSNAFIGFNAGINNTAGGNNTFVGSQAGASNTTGNSNTFMGYEAGYSNNLGGANTFMGYEAGNGNTTGSNNAFVGYGAGSRNGSGEANTFMGFLAGSLNTEGGYNVFIGSQAGRLNQTGIANVFIGSSAGYANTSGLGNMFLGQQAGGANTTASYNLFMGNSSGSNTTTGLGNTAVGDGSLLRNNSGFHNVAIGRYAGVESRNDENVFIGFSADVTPETPNLRNATAIGARARVSQSNSIVLGANANVGIGNGAPSAKLHITTGTANTSGLRLENLPISSTATGGQTKFLTVDGAGNVILGSLSGSAREGAVEALWQRKGSFLQSLNGESVVIGSKVDKTPAGYKLFVEDGILTEKVKVAVKNTSEWSDKVFDTGYPLKSLDEVGKYIQANKHLPGVPSAIEVVEKGIDVAKMDAKLLEKIEELTLYSIQLEKTNQRLQENDAKQQAQIDELKQLVKQLVDKK